MFDKKSAQNSLNEIYDYYVRTHSDINEHLDTLRKHAVECASVAEFGVRGGVSTYALLLGLMNNGKEQKSYIGVDIENCSPVVQVASKLSLMLGIEYEFIQMDSAKVDIQDVDMLFIDTWHIYGHLKRELENNHAKVRKYIAMHDTTVDEWVGESIRCGQNTKKMSVESGYPEDEITKGLWPAISEFLEAHTEWRLKERYTNNNGLTILERV
jgi:hypothetical protein